jgi:hypothetical protein
VLLGRGNVEEARATGVGAWTPRTICLEMNVFAATLLWYNCYGNVHGEDHRHRITAPLSSLACPIFVWMLDATALAWLSASVATGPGEFSRVATRRPRH